MAGRPLPSEGGLPHCERSLLQSWVRNWPHPTLEGNCHETNHENTALWPVGCGGHGHQVERPYKSRLISATEATTDCTNFVVVSTNPTVIECPYDGGTATRVTTHLGLNTNTVAGFVQIEIPFVPCVDYLGRTGNVSSASAVAVAVAADGSELFSHSEWTACFLEGQGGNASGTVTFTGGTGRFEGATGSGTFFSQNPGDGSVPTGISTGTITY